MQRLVRFKESNTFILYLKLINRFYIYGGYQILNGSLSDFYSIDLKDD
jgi:hypothetical protein